MVEPTLDLVEMVELVVEEVVELDLLVPEAVAAEQVPLIMGQMVVVVLQDQVEVQVEILVVEAEVLVIVVHLLVPVVQAQ